MFWYHANYPHNAVALNNFAFITYLLNTCTNFHNDLADQSILQTVTC